MTFKFQAYRFFKIALAFYLGFARERSKDTLSSENVSACNATRTSYKFSGPALLYAVVYTCPLHWYVVEVVGSRGNVLTLK